MPTNHITCNTLQGLLGTSVKSLKFDKKNVKIVKQCEQRHHFMATLQEYLH